MHRFRRFGLKLPIHAAFCGVFGGVFPSNNVTHRPGPEKHSLLAETRRLKYSAEHKNQCNGSSFFNFPVDFCMGLTTMQL